MTKLFGLSFFKALIAILALWMASTSPALADKASLKTNISAAREKVKAIVAGGDVAANKQDIVALTAKIDAEADTVPGFKDIWTDFKATRDGQIIPAYESGKPDEIASAKALATGVQAERFQKMLALLD